MGTMVVCKEIRKVGNGYIVEIRWPYGPDAAGCSEVVCRTWQEVIELLTKAANQTEDNK